VGWFVPWALLALYGAVFYLIAPSSSEPAGFYEGRDRRGRAPSTAILLASVFISWIFAKSVTNSANLAAGFGLPGAVAYGAYWLSIPLAALVIVGLRTRFNASSLPQWLADRYGRAAAWVFLFAILIRLFNEVWSNTAVVGSYFGQRGTSGFYAGALGFTALTLLYTLKGGLRSSIVTDSVQAILFALFLLAVLFFGLRSPGAGLVSYARSGDWALSGGVDLLLVALLQSLSYPFHDPVLTDRGFLSNPPATLKAFLWAGILGFLAIVAFGAIGLPAHVQNLPVDDDAPRAVASSLGTGVLLVVNVVMLTSAGSTLDSTFSSLSKALDRDARRVSSARLPDRSLLTGRRLMVAIAVLGNVPLLFGARILQATTISGTMVLGLAPIFLLGFFLRAPRSSFHLAFWAGLAVGILEVLDLVPAAARIGDGRYSTLLGANFWGLTLATALFVVPIVLQGARRARSRVVAAQTGHPSPSQHISQNRHS
jgi:Na+/proline symporter